MRDYEIEEGGDEVEEVEDFPATKWQLERIERLAEMYGESVRQPLDELRYGEADELIEELKVAGKAGSSDEEIRQAVERAQAGEEMVEDEEASDAELGSLNRIP